jgi:NADPH-dependent ferric siderophore reductase
MLRLTFEGPGLRELVVAEPAASVRLLVPLPGTSELILPEWNGNEFLLRDGTRPALRTFTPLRVDHDRGQLDLEIVRHPGGVVSGWAERADVGDPAALSGLGAGYRLDPATVRLFVVGDETALPAISQLLETAPPAVELDVHVEVVTDEAEVELPSHPGASVTWHVVDPGRAPGATLVDAIEALHGLDAGDRVWAAGEAASMHLIRVHLFETLGAARSQATVRGYWKRRDTPEGH